MTDLENKLLTSVYSEFYTGENGQCKYYSECLGPNEVPKHKCDRARIGENYGKDGIPKILFVGLEGFCRDDCVNESKIVNSFINPPSAAKNPHYNGLLYVAQYLLSEYVKCPKPNKVEINNNDEYQLTDKFALTNLYRCAFTSEDDMKKKRGLTHTENMQKHCQEIFLKEIETLQPDVLVIQSVDWPSGLFNEMKNAYGFDEPKLGFGKDNKTAVYLGKIKDKPLVLIRTYHGAYPKFKTEGYLENNLSPVLDEAIKLMK